jgi:hypothetical protein
MMRRKPLSGDARKLQFSPNLALCSAGESGGGDEFGGQRQRNMSNVRALPVIIDGSLHIDDQSAPVRDPGQADRPQASWAGFGGVDESGSMTVIRRNQPAE